MFGLNITAILGVVIAVLVGLLAVDHANLRASRAEFRALTAQVDANKRVAAATLRAENEASARRSMRLQDNQKEQERTDAKNVESTDGLRVAVRDARAGSVRDDGVRLATDPAGRGRGSGARPGEGAAAAQDRGRNRTAAVGLFPAAGTGTNQERRDFERWQADRINDAYRSCRVDAINLRSELSERSASP